MEGLFSDMWKDQDTIAVDHTHDITFKVCFSPSNFPLHSLFSVRQIALFVIGAAGITASFLFFFFFFFSFSRLLTYSSKDLEKEFRGKRKTVLFHLAIL